MGTGRLAVRGARRSLWYSVHRPGQAGTLDAVTEFPRRPADPAHVLDRVRFRTA
uniref:Uncharacterized protein n=1 Tax=uncultured marine virus TaxID=186617 RepID=A0A0F7L979_9VIRU|nr:hypothetical protein [uncultured marine virus]